MLWARERAGQQRLICRPAESGGFLDVVLEGREVR